MPVLRLSRLPRFPAPAATGTVAIRTPPADAYRVVSDPPVMIRLTEDAHRARRLGGTCTGGRRPLPRPQPQRSAPPGHHLP